MSEKVLAFINRAVPWEVARPSHKQIVPKTTERTLRLFWSFAVAYKKSLVVISVLLPIVVIVQNGLIPLLYSRIIDKLMVHAGTVNFEHWLLLFAGLHLSVLTGWRVIGYFWSRVEFNAIRDIEQQIFSWLLKQSHRFHTTHFAGASVAQAKRFTGAYSNFANTLYFTIAPLALRFLVAIGFLLFIAPSIAVVLAVWTAIYVASIVYLTKRKAHMSRAAAAADSGLTAQLSDVITNVMTVRMFGTEELETARYTDLSRHKAGKRFRDFYFSEAITGWQSLLMIFLETTVLYYSIRLVQSGSFTIGRLALVQFFLGPILLSLWNIASITRQVETSLSDAVEMTTILHHQPEIQNFAYPEPATITRGEIRFEAVDFGYQDGLQKPRQLFNDFNLHIKPGEKIGLVGTSGSGKSTLTKLLLRFSDIWSGSITVDGQDIREVWQEQLRKQMAYVPQEPLLFHRNIRENIRYGRPDATDEEVIAAAKQAYAHDFIMRTPEGYDTLVGERGGKLSGGERQRIAIARAFLKDVPIVILDEATSALDSESEQEIQGAFWNLMQGKTALVIAHRLSTIQQMNRIIVLDHGQIVEQGTHDELLANDQTYTNLWRKQTGKLDI